MRYLNHSRTYAVVTNQELLAAVADKKHLIHHIAVVCDAASTVKVTEGSDANDVRLIAGYFGANGGQVLGPTQYGPIELAPNTALKLSNSAGNVFVTVIYQTVT